MQRPARPTPVPLAPRLRGQAARLRAAALPCADAADDLERARMDPLTVERMRGAAVRMARAADDLEALALELLRPAGRWELVATWGGDVPGLSGTVVPASEGRHVRRSRLVALVTAWSWSRRSRRECAAGAAHLPPYRWRVRPLTAREG